MGKIFPGVMERGKKINSCSLKKLVWVGWFVLGAS